MPWVPEDEARVTTGEPPDVADRKNAGGTSELPDESEVTFLDDEPDPDEESGDDDERGDAR